MNKRTDLNQQEIIDILRSKGCSVRDLSQLGKGCPDLLVGYKGRNYLVEIKNAANRAPRLTPAEEEFIRGWKGQVAVITNIEDTIAVIYDTDRDA